jgi:ornithine cyclodeaminase
MRFVTAAEVSQALSFPLLVDALEAAHRRPKIELQDSLLGSEKEQYFVRNAVDRGRIMGSKLITSFPENLNGGMLPAVQAICVLFDGENGRPLAVIDGTEITYWKTAADSALGAKLLAPPSPQTLLVVGAGKLSRWLVRGHLSVRPSLRRVLIWNRDQQRAEKLAAELSTKGTAAEATADLEGATRSADVITTCTRSHAPLVKGANLKPGAHLDLVGGYTQQTREADDEAARRGLIFVDRLEAAASVGDIRQPIASGAIKEADVLGDLYDLVGGKVAGRRSSSDITLFKNAGGGHFDLIVAETVYRKLGAEA